MTLGLTMIALSMWYSTSLVPYASIGYFAWLRVFQMAGLPFLFIPISTVGYDGLPPDKTNQASSLINVARNLGGSVGISLANAELARRSQFHQARLIKNAVPSLPRFQSTLDKMTQYFMHQGSAQSDAHRRAMGLIGKLIEQQATILAYIDVFYLGAIVAIVMIPIVLILVGRVQSGRNGAGALRLSQCLTSAPSHRRFTGMIDTKPVGRKPSKTSHRSPIGSGIASGFTDTNSYYVLKSSALEGAS